MFGNLSHDLNEHLLNAENKYNSLHLEGNYYTLSEFDFTNDSVVYSMFKHRLKTYGALEFIKMHQSLNTPEIVNLKLHEKLYLVSMLEFLCRLNNVTVSDEVNSYKDIKMDKFLFESGVLQLLNIGNFHDKLVSNYEDAIPEFKHHNILITTVEDVI